jgi:4-amino-4-deoxy-L-arabinose transferase-like glycosyltransferase
MLPIAPGRRPLALELTLVVIVVLAVYLPGSWGYSLVDPWETHYGEVSREMLANHDFVHTDWAGNPDAEGFRSKPILQFWAMAASLRSFGLVADGGYSGELEHSPLTAIAIRLPFMLFGTLGLVMMWWMLARLVDRKLAWLALLVVGSCPFYCFVSRQAMPDMPLVATVIGAFSTFLMAIEDGDRPIDIVARVPLPGGRRLDVDARHVFGILVGGFIAVQALYYAYYFTMSPALMIRGRFPNPAVLFPLWMLGTLFFLSRDGWLIARIFFVLIGGIIAAVLGVPHPVRRPDQSLWRALFDNYLDVWNRFAPDRLFLSLIIYIALWVLEYDDNRARSFWPVFKNPVWAKTVEWSAPAFTLKPITTMRQIYMLWVYAFLGLGVLAKGPPGLGVIGLLGVFHVLLLGRWRELWFGNYEIKRGLVLMVVIFLPWHIAMYLKDGVHFVDEYLFTHILNRAAVGVDNSPGTFEVYTSQIGHGMWLWAGLLPGAFAATLLRARTDTRAGRVRLHAGIWAIAGAFFFSIVQTKFHHYILPIIPALGLLVAFLLHDILVHKQRLHFGFAIVGAGIVLLIARDLIFEPERWIEMFVFRYDRPWPNAEPWAVDPSDGFLALGIAGAIAILMLAVFRRAGVAAVCVVGGAICLWALQAYMPVAGTHWGMRDAIRTYYKQRTVYGEKLVYFGAGEVADDWRDVTDTWTFETFVPDNLQVGQPMTITVQLNKAEDERVTDSSVALLGEVSVVGDHDVTVKLAPGERKKLDPMLVKGSARGRPPVHVVDADRLIAWQLYWRGENFWSGNEIMGWPPEMKTVFMKTDNVDFLKYLNDRARAPLGRRYFLITEAGRAPGTKSMVPTQHGRDTFEVLDTSSNKFSLVSFVL